MSDRQVTVQDVIGAIAGRFDPGLLVDVSGERRDIVTQLVQQLALLSFHSGIEANELPSILRCRYSDQPLNEVPVAVLRESTEFLSLVTDAVAGATASSSELIGNTRELLFKGDERGSPVVLLAAGEIENAYELTRIRLELLNDLAPAH